MQSTNRKVFDNLVSRTKIYLVIILFLLILICCLNNKFIIPSVIVYILIISYTYFANNKRKSEISEQLQDLTITVDTTAKSSLINSPFPLIILETDGNIIWKSSSFVSEFANVDIDNYLDDLIYDIKDGIKNKKDKKERTIIKEINIDKKTYKVISKFVNSKNKPKDKKSKKEYMAVVYFIDETENVKLKKEYKNSKTCVGIIMIDNYEETMQLLESEEKPQFIAQIDKYIYEWANETNGIMIKTDRDKYIYLFEQKYLNEIKEDKFSILDKIKEIELKAKVQFTLSIAISN